MLQYHKKELSMKKFIIAGIRSDIGMAYARALQHHGKVYGLSRSTKQISKLEYYFHKTCDLMNPEDTVGVLDVVQSSDEWVYIHLPGEFRFQDENHPIVDEDSDGIDDSMYTSNVVTFKNIMPELKRHARTQKIKLVAIGSTADLYDVKYWDSFTRSKNELRKLFRHMYGDPELWGNISTLFVNVSTTDGSQLSRERPYIDKKYVLTPEDIVNESLTYLMDNVHSSIEINVLKPNPEFLEEDYFSDQRVRDRWYKDMYGE